MIKNVQNNDPNRSRYRGPFWKSLSAEKNWKIDPWVSFRSVSYAENKEKLLWFCSQGQMVQFAHLKFCRTIFVRIEKKTLF